MSMLANNAFFPIFTVVAFVAIVIFLEALYALWNTYKGPEAKKVRQRLQALSAGAQHDGASAALKNRMMSELPLLDRLLFALPRVNHLDRFLLQSGLRWTVSKFAALSILSGLTVLLLLTLIRLPPQLQWTITLPAFFLPFLFVQIKRNKRLIKMEAQLPEALDLIGRALRAGHALPSALKMAGDELSEPIAAEFRTTHDEINFGVSAQQALSNFGGRIPITDVRYFVVAIVIQRDAGGNLTEVLDNLSRLIRNRLKFHARVRVLTTEGRMSAWVLGLLPFGLAALLNIVNPEFISVLWTDPAGIKITNLILTMMAIGAIWLYKLIQIRV